MRRIAVAVLLLLTAACGRGVPDDAQIVVAGDSVMAWNRVQGAGVADQLSERLAQPVGDVSLPYASVTGSTGSGPLDISRQVSGLSARWVVMNGGANDLGVGCSGAGTGAILNRLISADGRTGAIPDMVAKLRARNVRVLWADYYTSPRFVGTPCGRVYDQMAGRTARMAAADPGVFYVDMGDVVQPADASVFARDRIHPSHEGSARIAALIADALRSADPATTRAGQ
ncbi:SGNH/GDSL hydrolase family protein [Thalassococcus sp. BH17M4-6]|uniref:SGNH/GDSL hydrolase family protein n=1 Tax=Thalassococcus sp. BH17M4-6 TaxID=3413148 RepID=UPI003BEDC0E1